MLESLEHSLIFFPTQELLATPQDYGHAYDEVELITDDSLHLHGWWIPASPERGVLLFFHGNAGNIGDRLDSIEIFHRLGLSVLIIDYRGYGHSEGRPSEEGTYTDARAAWRYLTIERGISSERIVVFGRSLGAGVATWLASQHAPRALIIESAFTSVPDMAATAYPFMPGRSLLRTRYDNLARMGSIACPLLVVHSRGDELIPFEHGRRLYEAAHEPKSFLAIIGSHNDGFYVSGSDYTDGIDRFLRRHLDRKDDTD